MDLSQKQTLKRRFKALDENGDGVLNFKELKNMLSGGQSGMTQKEVQVLFKAVDQDRSGYVDFDEFVDFVFQPPLGGVAPGEWFDSAFSGDLEAISRLARCGTEIDARDSRESVRYPCSAAMTAAMYAAAAGHGKCLQKLADLSCNLHAQDANLGKTAAMFAAEEGHHECLLILAENGINLDTKDVNGFTTAMLCAMHDEISCLKLLIKKRADLDAQDAKGWTAAMHAARCGNALCLQLIAKAGADLDEINNDRQTAAILAVDKGDELCVRILAMQGVDLLVKDFHGNTALMEAARLGYYLCARLLQRHTKKSFRLGLLFVGRAELRQDTQQDVAASASSHELFDAVWYGKDAALSALLDQEDFSHKKAIDGWNAPMVAALRGHEACLQLLLSSGPDLSDTDSDGYTVTMLAAMKGHTTCVEMLARHNADLNAVNDDGFTAGMLAAKGGHADCLGLLGQLRADLNYRPEGGSTAAMLFLLKREQIFAIDPEATDDLCDRLLREGMEAWANSHHNSWRSRCDSEFSRPSTSTPSSPAGSRSPCSAGVVNICDLEERRNASLEGAWFRAAANGIHKALSKLLELSASVDAMSNTGMTAMMIAAESGDHPSVKLLVKAGGDANIKDQCFERTALSLAAEEGHLPCIRILLDEGDALVDARDCSGRTPLMEAALHGHDKAVRFLARRRADLDIYDAQMSSPATLAATQGHLDCVRVLAEHGADLLATNHDGSVRNVLHLIEQSHDLNIANSIVGDLDWTAAAAKGCGKVCEALQASTFEDKSHAAALHLNLWKEDDWNRLHMRDRGFTEDLFGCLQELLASCRDRNLTSTGKRTLGLLLGSGLLKAVKDELPAEYGSAVVELNGTVLEELEKALEERQDHLHRVATLTPEPDVYLPRRDRHNRIVQTKLDQRDAMPQSLWAWLEELPDDCFQRLELAFRVFRILDLAVTPNSFVTYLRSHNMHVDGALYSKAAAHIMVGYAALVQEHFERFMQHIFGKHFKPAPVKKLPRIFSKMQGDVPELAVDSLAAEDADLRCAYFALGDVVRGSVWADGPREMISTVERLQSLDSMSDFGRFDAWRIKNTHHERAGETTGGYRDVKVLGRFRAKQKKRGAFKLPISMVVEIQVIDAVYLDIKKYMHKAYAIDRGDFD